MGVAALQPGRRTTEAVLREHCAAGLAAFKAPAAVLIGEAIPRNPNGKADRETFSLRWQ